MSVEEEIFAKVHNAAEYSEIHELLNMEALETIKEVSEDPVFCSTCFNISIEEVPEYQNMETSETLREIRRLRPGPLVAPKIGAMLRIRSKWENCS